MTETATPNTPTQTIAFLGLGAMGARMAAHLLDAGFDLVVWNRTPSRADALVDRGARRAETPAAAARNADVVLSIVTDDAASEQVWQHPETGVLAGARPGTLCLESSTLTPGRQRALAAAATAAGMRFLDAPVVGTRPHADNRLLVFLVGGDTADVDAARPALDAMGQKVVHVGPHGSGAVLKLAVNSLLAVQCAAFAEVLGMLERAGIGAEAGMAALANTAVCSPAMQVVGARIAALDTAPNFPVGLVEKDLRYVVSAAEALGGRAPVAAAAGALYAELLADHADADLTAIGHLHRG